MRKIEQDDLDTFGDINLRNMANDGSSELTCAAVDAEGARCAECGDGPDSRGKLIIFATRIGARIRVHEGMFCSQACHDRWHGLKPKGVN